VYIATVLDYLTFNLGVSKSSGDFNRFWLPVTTAALYQFNSEFVIETGL